MFYNIFVMLECISTIELIYISLV